MVALGTFVAAVSAIISCKLIGAADGDICNGVSIYNCILLGGVVTGLTPIFTGASLNIYYYIFLALGAFATYVLLFIFFHKYLAVGMQARIKGKEEVSGAMVWPQGSHQRIPEPFGLFPYTHT